MRKLLVLTLAAFAAIFLNAQTLSLEDCRELALEKSFASKEAKLNIKAAQYQRSEALTEFFPRISVTGAGLNSLYPLIEIGVYDIENADLRNFLINVTRDFGLENTYRSKKYGYTASVVALQPIFAGGRIINGNKLAALGVQAAELTDKVQSRKTIEELDEYYWQNIDLEDKMQTLLTFKNLVDTLCKDAASALSAGLITEGEYRQAELKRGELRATEVKLKNGIKLSKINLLNYIGYDYEFLKLDSINFAYPTETLVDPICYYEDEQQIASRLEELSLLDLNIQSKRLMKQMELGATLPQIAIGASYGYSGIGEHDRKHTVAFATVSVPISDWWKASLKQQRLQTEIDKAAAQKEYLSEQLVLLVRKTWVELCGAWDAYELALDAEAAASQSYYRQQAQYKAGLITMADLLQSQAAYQSAYGTRAESVIAYRKALNRWEELRRSKSDQ